MATLVLLWLGVATVPAAQRIEPTPAELEEVGVTEHLNAQIPLDLPFVDSDGKRVTLGDFFDGTRPVLLTMNYSNCPMLCSLQLTGLFEGLSRMSWQVGENFRMVTVSMDTKEIPDRARLTRQKYLKIYGRPVSAGGWHFLTGEEKNIRRLAATIGFGYRYDPASGQYAHPAVTFVCTPTGHVSRYLYGIEYDPQTLRLALVEAGQGKVGSTLDRVLLYCFHYDESKGRYGPAAVKIMRVGALVTMAALGGAIALLWRREKKRARHKDHRGAVDDATS
jgi:protein SCO1/2